MTKDTERDMLDYAEHNFNERYFLLYVAKRESGQTLKRDHRNRMRQFMYSRLKIPKELQKSAHQRGIYYSTFYENSREFLRGEIEQDQLVRNSNDGSVETLTQLWKEKYAAKRINNLMNDERQKLTETLFYDDIITMSWEECKFKYLGAVGR
jgi:inner membrane protein involved in colicin E2 resistance